MPAPEPPPVTFTPPPIAPAAAPAGEPLNPWLSLWTRPRATMRQILDTYPRRWVHSLAILGGIAELLSAHIPDTPPFPTFSPGAMLAVKCVAGACAGLLLLYLGSFVVWITGRWIGGQGTFVEVRAASAWPNVLTLWGALLWLPIIAYLGTQAFNVDPESFMDDSVGMMLILPVLAIGVFLSIWRFFVALKCLAEAHRFSAWQALGAVLIGFVLLVIPVAILAGIGIGLMGLSALSGGS
jgi:hypothetical protein